MTQKRISRYLFCVFLLFFSLSSFAQNRKDNRNQHFYANIENCNDFLITKYSSIHNTVTTAYSNLEWRITEKVKEKSVLLIEYEDELFLYGLHNLKKELLISDLKSLSNRKNFCIYRNTKNPYLYIKKNELKKEKKENGFYVFLKPGISDQYQELIVLRNYFGPILYTNLELLTELSLKTLEIKITHEAVHLFGQEEIQNFSPEFKPFLTLSNIDSNIDSRISISQKNIDFCQLYSNSKDEIESREYLQFKEKCFFEFRKLVIKEICLAQNLIQIIIENKKNKISQKQILNLLMQIKETLKMRTELFDDQGLQLEWYWYLVEGVPQYLEQKVTINKNIDRISDHYQSYCNQVDGYEDVFYALLTGAAIWHGLEYLNDSRDDWDYLATQSEHNVRMAENATSWFDEFDAILNRIRLKIEIDQ